MRKLVYYVGVSIDGYIAGPDGQFDFFPLPEDVAAWMAEDYPETIPVHVRPHMGIENAPNKRFDTVVMGLGTYRPGLEIGLASPYPHLRQYVVTTTLAEAPDPAVHLIRDIGDVRTLKKEDSPQDIWMAGGGKLAGALLPEIDELIVKGYPVVAGAGIPAFDGGFSPTPFTVAGRRAFADGTAVTHFTR